MNVLIIGANGKVGQKLVEKMKDSENYTPIAMVRKTEQQEKYKSQGVETVLTDLEGSIDPITKAAKKADAIVFTAGAGGAGDDKTMLVDLDGAVKSMKAAERADIKRFVLISGNGVHKWHENTHQEWMDEIPVYSAAKYYADVWLQNTDLDYTIIRPGHLNDGEGSGKIQIGDELGNKPMAREDVASVILASLEEDQTIGKAFDVINGDTSIEEALSTL